MAQQEEPWDLVIGQVTAPFGIRGEVKVRPETEAPERFTRLRQVCLELPSGEERLVRIRKVRLIPKFLLVIFTGYEDRDRANSLRGAWIKIRESMALPLPEGRYYLHHLLGLQVVTEAGEELGEITEVLQYPANDIYVTPKAMIPALKEVVKKIDLEQKRMVVALLPEATSEEGAA